MSERSIGILGKMVQGWAWTLGGEAPNCPGFGAESVPQGSAPNGREAGPNFRRPIGAGASNKLLRLGMTDAFEVRPAGGEG